jgi:hypothetical protein
MLAKVGLVIAGTALAMFAMGRFESVAAHRGFGGPVACAQETNDSGDDASAQDDADSEAAMSASGIYSGTIMDSGEGDGMISASLSQIHSKLIGTFVATFPTADYGPGFVKGKIQSNGAINARLKFSLKGKCGVNFHGTFVNGNEITGDYTMTGCKGMSNHGTFDMTHQ